MQGDGTEQQNNTDGEQRATLGDPAAQDNPQDETWNNYGFND